MLAVISLSPSRPFQLASQRRVGAVSPGCQANDAHSSLLDGGVVDGAPATSMLIH